MPGSIVLPNPPDSVPNRALPSRSENHVFPLMYITRYLMTIGEPGVAGSCEFLYYRGWNGIQILNDAANAWEYWGALPVRGQLGTASAR